MAMTPEAERQARLMALLAPHHDRARATARRLCRSNADGDDLFHEALLRALDHVDELRDQEKFRAWFYAVLLSVHRTRHRRNAWRRWLPLDQARVEPAISDGAEAIEGAQRMARALATLAPEQREAIVLFELEGFTLEEVAALQQQSIPAVKSRLARARARLRRHYERHERVSRLVVAGEKRHGHG
jgi:RNA polymerase sigma-70 factor (ECF subfamily)